MTRRGAQGGALDAKPRTAPMARRREGERSRGCAAGGATGRRALRGYVGRTETPPQNSQRVLLAKPRTAVASRHGRWGARREPGGPVAEHRILPQRDWARGRGVRGGDGTGRWGAAMGPGDGARRGAGRGGAVAMGRAARWGHRALPQRDRARGRDGAVATGRAARWDRARVRRGAWRGGAAMGPGEARGEGAAGGGSVG